MRKKPTPAGDLVYLSERKLLNLAIQLGLRTGSFDREVEVEGSAGLDAGIPPIGRVSAKGSVRTEYTDPGKRAKALATLLSQVVQKLGGDRLPNLEDAEGGIREGGWFRFHRMLRFGVGHADAIGEVKALIVVDERQVPQGLSIPGLLMNGSVAHVLDPYATDEMRNAPGSRSGSSSDRLFVWLDDARRALEADPQADPLSAMSSEYFQDELPPRDPYIAMEMYRVFAEERWVNPPLFPRLLNGGPCEGIAQASFIAVDDTATLVMGSPLFVRVCALPAESEPRGRRFLRRG
jgi:hypothetical protein